MIDGEIPENDQSQCLCKRPNDVYISKLLSNEDDNMI